MAGKSNLTFRVGERVVSRVTKRDKPPGAHGVITSHAWEGNSQWVTVEFRDYIQAEYNVYELSPYVPGYHPVWHGPEIEQPEKDK